MDQSSCIQQTPLWQPFVEFSQLVLTGPGGMDQGLFANLAAFVAISPSLGLLSERLQLKRVVPVAVDRAICEVRWWLRMSLSFASALRNLANNKISELQSPRAPSLKCVSCRADYHAGGGAQRHHRVHDDAGAGREGLCHGGGREHRAAGVAL